MERNEMVRIHLPLPAVAGDNALANTYSGDGGPATSAGLNYCVSMTLNDSGDMYLIDYHNQVIRAKKKPSKKSTPAKSPKSKKVEKKVQVTKNKKETKSSKILAMYLKGSKVSEISKALKAHPSFCYTVIGKHKAKNK